MKKIVIIVGALLVAGLLGATWYSSFQAEKIFAAQAEKTGELYGPAVKVSLDDYTKGLLQSEARTSVVLGKAVPLHLLHKVTHLPWGAKVVTTVNQEAYDEQGLAEIGAYLPLEQLQMVSHFGLTGNSDMRMNIPVMETDRDGLRIRLQGLEMNGSLNAGMDDGDFDFKVASMQVRTPEIQDLTFDGFHGFFNYREQGGFPLGEGVLQLDKILLNREGVAGYELNGLSYRFNSTLTDRTLNQYVDVAFADLAVAGEACSNGRLKFEITGMDADAARALQEVYGSMSAEALAGSDVDPFLIQLQIMSKTVELLQKGMHFKLETLALETAGGNIHAQGFVDVENMQQENRPAFDVKGVRAGATVYFDADAFVSGYRLVSAMQGEQFSAEDLSSQAASLAQSLVSEGILVKTENNGLEAELSFAEGKASLNGKPVSQ
ncbi:protein of unknown function DUF945 [Syntrophotalea carbinolica DSM 2380]|uniref:DUF945 domain-containing protein n=1 Tax=Syntrophotalea carbinolica (strain DSM 2380 / NBRC 103641 / GraBd1) TaxID=338963 RepID=Q3A118_SYNC1|nr:YdgA family protein [Syntrophotalea carbinolica]ABA89939.1 protein of unknown function DUF945 [Syntrophotalea carbinolica DSM 2380]